MFSSFHNSRVEVEVCSLSGLVYCLEVTSTTSAGNSPGYYMNGNRRRFFPWVVAFGLNHAPSLPLHSCDLLSVGDDANKVH